jgi:hypothetical protein
MESRFSLNEFEARVAGRVTTEFGRECGDQWIAARLNAKRDLANPYLEETERQFIFRAWPELQAYTPTPEEVLEAVEAHHARMRRFLDQRDLPMNPQVLSELRRAAQSALRGSREGVAAHA